MIRLYAEQLTAQLQKILYPCYLLFGNDPLLLQKSQDLIRKLAKEQQFNEHFSVTLDSDTNWEAIFNLFRVRSLFTVRQTLLLILPDGNINTDITEKMLQLTSMLHKNVLLILRGCKLTRSIENVAWFKALSQHAVLVSCVTPELSQLPYWIKKCAENMKLTLDDEVCQLLCYHYEGNLLALSQVLEQLSLFYPDGILTLQRVKAAINDAAHFMPFHWVDAALAGKSKRTMHILRQLQLEATEPVILLRKIQCEVLLLLKIKQQMIHVPLHILFSQYKIWQNRRSLMTQALTRLTIEQLRNIVTLMVKIELMIKQDCSYLIWSNLEMLALLLCGKSLPSILLNF